MRPSDEAMVAATGSARTARSMRRETEGLQPTRSGLPGETTALYRTNSKHGLSPWASPIGDITGVIGILQHRPKRMLRCISISPPPRGPDDSPIARHSEISYTAVFASPRSCSSGR